LTESGVIEVLNAGSNDVYGDRTNGTACLFPWHTHLEN